MTLCLTAFSSHLIKSDIQELVPFIVRHAHGPQDTQPLQSVLIRVPNEEHSTSADILAWPVPNIDVEVHELPTFLTATPSTRLALSFRCIGDLGIDDDIEVCDIVMVCLPLNRLVTLATHDLSSRRQAGQGLAAQNFWHHLLPMWPLLQLVRLAPAVAHGFIATLLEDNGGREKPLLPSLTQLIMVNFPIYSPNLSNALRKRVEQRVPVKVLDVRMCSPLPNGRTEDWIQSLSNIVGEILHPARTYEAWEQMESIPVRNAVAQGPFVDSEDSSED